MHYLRYSNSYLRDSSTGDIIAIDLSALPSTLSISLSFTVASGYPTPASTATLTLDTLEPPFRYTGPSVKAGSTSYYDTYAGWEAVKYKLICNPPDLLLYLDILTYTKALHVGGTIPKYCHYTGTLSFTASAQGLTRTFSSLAKSNGNNNLDITSASIV